MRFLSIVLKCTKMFNVTYLNILLKGQHCCFNHIMHKSRCYYVDIKMKYKITERQMGFLRKLHCFLHLD